MTGRLTYARKKLPADDPWLKIALDGKSPQAVAEQSVSGTKLADPAFRKQLLDGGVDAVNTLDRPDDRAGPQA